MVYSLFRILHFVAIAVLVGCVVLENMAVGETLNKEDRRNLRRVDRFVGPAAMAVLVIGLVLWFGVGKPASFYSLNPLFHAKVGLFIVAALISLAPTLFFIRQVKAEAEEVTVPSYIRLALRAQLLLLAIMPVLAWLMARGVGLANS